MVSTMFDFQIIVITWIESYFVEDETKTLGFCLKRSLLFPRLRWIFVCLAWIHIFMVMDMLKFASRWHRSTLYVWYLCPILSPLSHGSMMYSSSHACLFLPWICLVLVYSHDLVTCVYESKILMYYRCLLDDMLRSSWHFHLKVTIVLSKLSFIVSL